MPAPEHEPSSDDPPRLYLQAARFSTERKAGRAYFQVQDAIFTTDCDLSAYRFLLNRISHVAVLGAPPPQELDRSIRRILASGEPTPLPAEIVETLLQRRAQQTRLGLWVEQHHRPGRPL